MTQDRINIIEPNGVKRTRPISPYGLTIGRGADNDLTLAYDSISRYHVQVTYEGGHYYVTDLNSSNGTYINKNRLASNIPTEWPSGQVLQVGQVDIYLEQVAQQPQVNTVDKTDATTIGQLPDDTLFRDKADQNKRQIPVALVLVIGVILLCFLIALITGVYFLFL